MSIIGTLLSCSNVVFNIPACCGGDKEKAASESSGESVKTRKSLRDIVLRKKNVSPPFDAMIRDEDVRLYPYKIDLTKSRVHMISTDRTYVGLISNVDPSIAPDIVKDPALHGKRMDEVLNSDARAFYESIVSKVFETGEPVSYHVTMAGAEWFIQGLPVTNPQDEMCGGLIIETPYGHVIRRDFLQKRRGKTKIADAKDLEQLLGKSQMWILDQEGQILSLDKESSGATPVPRSIFDTYTDDKVAKIFKRLFLDTVRINKPLTFEYFNDTPFHERLFTCLMKPMVSASGETQVMWCTFPLSQVPHKFPLVYKTWTAKGDCCQLCEFCSSIKIPRSLMTGAKRESTTHTYSPSSTEEVQSFGIGANGKNRVKGDVWIPPHLWSNDILQSLPPQTQHVVRTICRLCELEADIIASVFGCQSP